MELKDFPIDLLTLLMFTVPGYFVVWSFHKANKSEPKSDFERLIFSVFWGVVMLCSYPLLTTAEQLKQLLGNPFATMMVFSFLGVMVGAFGATLVEIYRDINDPAFRSKLKKSFSKRSSIK